jgi:hypothetical protein
MDTVIYDRCVMFTGVVFIIGLIGIGITSIWVLWDLGRHDDERLARINRLISYINTKKFKEE